MPEHISHFVFLAPSNAHECLLFISTELTDKLGSLKSRTILRKQLNFLIFPVFFECFINYWNNLGYTRFTTSSSALSKAFKGRKLILCLIYCGLLQRNDWFLAKGLQWGQKQSLKKEAYFILIGTVAAPLVWDQIILVKTKVG